MRAVLLLMLSFSGYAADPQLLEPKNPSVLLISIDGCRPQDLSNENSPELLRWAAQGQEAQGLVPIFPSLTFPNHTTMVTGKSAEQHGIVSNEMNDAVIEYTFKLGVQKAMEDPRWWKDAEPLWIVSERHGKKAATLFWPGSESSYSGKRQSYWLPYNQKLSPLDRVEKIIEWFRLPVGLRPQFATLYFDTVDSAGHRSGPGAPEVQAALFEVDQALKHLREELEASGLWKSLNVVVVSDHGMMKTDPSKTVFMSEIFQPGEIKTVAGGATFGVDLGTINLKQFYARLPKNFPFYCKPKEKLPKEFEYSKNARIPQLVCFAFEASYGSFERRKVSLGAHGYDPRNPQMNGIFLAKGPKFPKSKKIPAFPNRQIYGLILRALEIKDVH